MFLFNILFEGGERIQEYGDNVEDVRQFCARVWPERSVKDIALFM